MWERLQAAFHHTLASLALRRVAVMVVDGLVVVESFALALLFRFNGEVPYGFWRTFWVFAVFSALAFVLLLNWNSVYQRILSSAPTNEEHGRNQDVRVLSATAMAAGGLFLAVFCIGPFGIRIMEFNPVPLSVVLVGSLFAFVQLAARARLYPQG
jgi:hypothetical protein